jgi:hypothetical protein
MPSFNVKDMAVGAVFAAIAIAFMTVALATLDIGTAFRMGPGYFPLVLAGLLLLLGIVVMATSLNAPEEAVGGVPWRGLALILAAPLLFGATARGLGMLISLPLTIFVAAIASSRAKLPTALALVLGLTVFCVLVFAYGLGLPLPLVGTWLR